MSWLSNLAEGKPVIREWSSFDKQVGWSKQLNKFTGDIGGHWTREFRKNIEMPWKSGFKAGTESGLGDIGGIIGGIARVSTDWLFQNTGPYKDTEPAWSDVPGADDLMNQEQLDDKYGKQTTGDTGGKDDKDDKDDGDDNGDDNGDDDNKNDTDATANTGDGDDITDKPPAASAALAALLRRRIKMRRGRSSTVLTGGAKIGKGSRKKMAEGY
jgi:hypothetical protein